MKVKETLKKQYVGNKTITTFETEDSKYHTLVKEKDIPVHHYEFLCSYDSHGMAMFGHHMIAYYHWIGREGQ